ncbi:hypothetical protein LTS10_006905 [Elasticomyces elasticus]|nr:hypothetical protein LTS10_006905 [Elasticomyces elasticus]
MSQQVIKVDTKSAARRSTRIRLREPCAVSNASVVKGVITAESDSDEDDDESSDSDKSEPIIKAINRLSLRNLEKEDESSNSTTHKHNVPQSVHAQALA